MFLREELFTIHHMSYSSKSMLLITTIRYIIISSHIIIMGKTVAPRFILYAHQLKLNRILFNAFHPSLYCLYSVTPFYGIAQIAQPTTMQFSALLHTILFTLALHARTCSSKPLQYHGGLLPSSLTQRES